MWSADDGVACECKGVQACIVEIVHVGRELDDNLGQHPCGTSCDVCRKEETCST